MAGNKFFFSFMANILLKYLCFLENTFPLMEIKKDIDRFSVFPGIFMNFYETILNKNFRKKENTENIFLVKHF